MNPITIAAITTSVLTPVVLTLVLLKRMHFEVSVTDASGFLRELRERVAEHLRANYSGDPAQLESALRGVVPIARDLAALRRLDLKEDTLRLLIVDAVNRAGVAKRHQVEAATRSAMEAQRSAA